MKLLFFHAKDLKIDATSDTRKRRRCQRRIRKRLGSALPELDGQSVVSSENALLVFVCVENHDVSMDLRMVCKDILESRVMLGAAEIVIGSFAHLSNDLADPSLARRIIDELASEVLAGHPGTKSFPFGYDKSIDMHVPLHHYNCAFKSYPKR